METHSLIEELGLTEEYKLVANKDNKLVFAHTVYYEIDEPDYEQFETENDEPVDNIFSEIQQRLFIDPLHNNQWTERDFWASANVGIYYAVDKPPIVPDMFLSFDVKKPKDWFEKKNKCYFTWLVGKVPELVAEIVSNKIGNEGKDKMKIYAQMGVKYYILLDPYLHLSTESLNVFELNMGKYEKIEVENSYMPEIQLGIMIWEGLFEQEKAPWARWCNKEGNLLYTGGERTLQEKERAEQEKERAEQEKERAEQEKERAEQEKQRADKLLAKLKTLGLTPEELQDFE
jgi:hypothetical protein